MPPRYAYWTIIIDNQPTAFRSAAVEELIPTFNRLKSKQPTAVLKWFQDGKLWDSRLDAREANIRKRRDERPKPEGRPSRPAERKLEWQPKGAPRPSTNKTRWQPKGEARPSGVGPKLEWSPRGAKPAGNPPRSSSSDWRPRADRPSGPPSDRGARGDKPSAFAKASADRSGLSNDRPAPRDSKWRPGGEHRDPRQKYKDAKKAKWTRFKQAIRGRRAPRKP